MILHPSLVNLNGKPTGKWHGVYPGFPKAVADYRVFREFTGYPHSLPDKATVEWQLAKLTNCSKVYEPKSNTENGSHHVRKHGCTWTPIRGRIFQKKVDMAAIRNSLAYKRTGKPVDGSYLYGTYTLNIKLLFKEDQLTVKATNGQTEGFGQ